MWNSDNFDIPYLYQYLLTHVGTHSEVAKIMSSFGELDLDEGKDRAGNKIHWVKAPEWNVVDLLYCYKERAD